MTKEYKGTVYAIITTIGRVYIGSTMKDLKTRISSGIGYKNTNPELYADMQKGKGYIKELKSFTGKNYNKIEKRTSEMEFYFIIKYGNEYFNTKDIVDKPYNKSGGYRKLGKYGNN